MPGIVARIGGRPPLATETDDVLTPLHHFPYYESAGDACNRGWLGWVGIGDAQRRLSRDPSRRYLTAYHGDGAAHLCEADREARTGWIADLADRDCDQLCRRLGGSFAAARLDTETGAFHCLTDRFGHHRVYYRQVGDTLYLACELKAFLAWPEFPIEPDPAALRDVINYGYPFGDRSSLAGVKLLPPSSRLEFRDGRLTVDRYWQPRYEEQEGDDAELRDEGHRLFLESFAAKTDGAPRLVVPVSGGLDSRILLGAALAQGQDLLTYTYGHSRSHENEVARRLMREMGVADTHVVLDDYPGAQDAVRRAVWFGEGMVNATIAHLEVVLGHFEQEPRSAVFVNGIYGGPTNFSAAYHKPHEMVTDMPRAEKVDRIGQTMFSRRLHSPANYRKLTRAFAAECDASYDREIEVQLDRYESVSPVFGHQKDAFYHDNRLCRFMNQVDLNRYHWDETIPLTSVELYDFYLRLPDRLKFGRKLHRQILVHHYPQAAALPTSSTGISVTDELAGKPPRPPQNRWRKLQHWTRRLSRGLYDPPEPGNFRSHDWHYRRNKPLRQFYEDVLGDPQPLSAEYFDFDIVRDYLRRLRQGAFLATALAEVMAWELWLRQLRDRRLDP